MDNVFFEVYEDMPQFGPGSSELSKQAFLALPGLPERPLVLDIGSGIGHHSILLHKEFGARCTALEYFDNVFQMLTDNIRKHGLSDQIECVQGDMKDMHFPKASFDLIWSESSVYNIGFEKALGYWRQFLAPGGCMAISEIHWARDNRPKELTDFWALEYPGMHSRNEAVEIIKRQNCMLIDTIEFPDYCWWDNCYKPLQERVDKIRKKYAGDSGAMATLDSMQHEIDMYLKYKDYIAYTFFLIKP